MKQSPPNLEIENKIYIYEDFCKKVVSYTIVGIFISKEETIYHVEAYDENGAIFNYRTCSENDIDKTAFLSFEEATKKNEKTAAVK